jgi:Tfp pilus assembly protein PilZ
VVRLTQRLAARQDWVRLFDPRGGGLFVPVDDPPPVGEEVRVDLTIEEEGPRVILRGTVLARRATEDARGPAGCSVGLPVEEKAKINFLNGYVRGGLINRRERRRLPLRLPVTWGGIEGPRESHSRDLNEEGIFVVTEQPLPEGSELHLRITIPGRPEPLPLAGSVTHTVIVEDEDVPGMGIVFRMPPEQAAEVAAIVDELEAAFLKGALPEAVIA